MYAITAQLILLFAAAGVSFSRQSNPDDVIWYPVEDVSGAYESSLGEYYITNSPNQWLGVRSATANDLPRPQRRHRSLSLDGRYNEFDANREFGDIFKSFEDDLWERPDNKRENFADDRILFPGFTDLDSTTENNCQTNCPLTPEYNPVCGTDLNNYNNIGALKCAQKCGRNVNFAHYGVCGRGLPLIFRPTPRQPRSTTQRTTGDFTDWRVW